MEIIEAKNMIATARFATAPQTWLDLGCGSGIFTLALAELLPFGSTIVGVDKEKQNLPKQSLNGNKIDFFRSDMLEIQFDKKIDGILIANALHYVENQTEFIEHFRELMPEKVNIVLVEYDTEIANQWVPFPVQFGKLPQLFTNEKRIEKLGQRQSIYNSSIMYAAQIQT